MSGSPADSVVSNPEVRLEDVRWHDRSNTCDGRGRETASSRGYNAERLAHVVMNQLGFRSVSFESWYDDYVLSTDNMSYEVEVKSCIDRYETASGEEGGYGQFRIWKQHHDQLLEEHEKMAEHGQGGLYFFVVYTVEHSIEKEIGKLVAPVEMVDDVLNTWLVSDHVTMGSKKNRQISWRLLLKKLGVSRERFENEPIINLLDE